MAYPDLDIYERVGRKLGQDPERSSDLKMWCDAYTSWKMQLPKPDDSSKKMPTRAESIFSGNSQACFASGIEMLDDSRKADFAIRTLPDRIREAAKLGKREIEVIGFHQGKRSTPGEKRVTEFLQENGYNYMVRLSPNGRRLIASW